MNYEKRIDQLTKLFGRKIDLKIESFNNYSPKTITVRFPKSEKGFLNEKIIFLTIGMSDEIESEDDFQKIELSAITHQEYQNEPESDFIASIVNWMAHFSYREHVIYELGEIFEWGNQFVNDCELENLYLSVFPIGEEYQEKYDELKNILNVDDILNLIPISNSEKQFADEKGVIELLKIFEKNELDPSFHFFRKSIL